MNTNNGNRDRENRQGVWWKYVVVGGSVTVVVYGICKFLTKGQWKVKVFPNTHMFRYRLESTDNDQQTQM